MAKGDGRRTKIGRIKQNKETNINVQKYIGQNNKSGNIEYDRVIKKKQKIYMYIKY